MKKKIGIMTIWWSKDNYGQFLQMFALQKALEQLGHSPFLIRYNKFGESRSDKILKLFNPVKLFSSLKHKLTSVSSKAMSEPDRGFDRFMNKYIKVSDNIYNTYSQLKTNPPEADWYITGSDQVWHYTECNSYNNDRIRAYFLDFGDEKIRRASYAASFSLKTLDDNYREFIRPLLKKLDKVTVREENGLEMCRQAGCDDAVLVADPTLLLSKEEWISQLDLKIKKENDYAFLYLLGYDMKCSIEELVEFVKTKKLDLRYVASAKRKDEYAKIFPTITQWLEEIAGAELVITNSFHGTVFCLIFNIPFIVLPLEGAEHGIMNCRLTSLLTKFKLEYRFTSENIDDIMKMSIDWISVNEILSDERKRSLRILKETI